jgi:hypothetical protein
LTLPGSDPPFVAHLGGAVPGGGAPAPGSDVEVVAEPDDPHRHRGAQRAVASERRDLQFFCCSDLVELVARPFAHLQTSTMTLIASRSFIAL